MGLFGGTEVKTNMTEFSAECHSPRGGGGTPLFGLYGDVPLDRVWFFGLGVLNRVYNLTCLCHERVKNLSLAGYGILFNFSLWYYEPRDLNADFEQSLSFLACDLELARS